VGADVVPPVTTGALGPAANEVVAKQIPTNKTITNLKCVFIFFSPRFSKSQVNWAPCLGFGPHVIIYPRKNALSAFHRLNYLTSEAVYHGYDFSPVYFPGWAGKETKT